MVGQDVGVGGKIFLSTAFKRAGIAQSVQRLVTRSSAKVSVGARFFFSTASKRAGIAQLV
jgi:hypothetical protein